LRSGFWEPAKKMDCFKLLRIAKPENWIFFLQKSLILRTVLVSPLFYFFWNREPTQFSHRGQKKPKPMVLKKKVRTAHHWYAGAGSLAGKWDPQKRTYPLCTYPAGLGGGWRDHMWTVNPIVLLMRIDSVLGLWTSINGHGWESSGKNAQKIH